MPNPLRVFLASLKEDGWTIAKIANEIGYSREHLTRLKNEEKPGDPESIALFKLEKTFPATAAKVMKTSHVKGKIKEMDPDEWTEEKLVLLDSKLNVLISLLADVLIVLHPNDKRFSDRAKLLETIEKELANEYRKERTKQSSFRK